MIFIEEAIILKFDLLMVEEILKSGTPSKPDNANDRFKNIALAIKLLQDEADAGVD